MTGMRGGTEIFPNESREISALMDGLMALEDSFKAIDLSLEGRIVIRDDDGNELGAVSRSQDMDGDGMWSFAAFFPDLPEESSE